jgi:hypothetical protein
MIHHDNESTPLDSVHIFTAKFKGPDLEAPSSRDIFEPKCCMHFLFTRLLYVLHSSYP